MIIVQWQRLRQMRNSNQFKGRRHKESKGDNGERERERAINGERETAMDRESRLERLEREREPITMLIFSIKVLSIRDKISETH